MYTFTCVTYVRWTHKGLWNRIVALRKALGVSRVHNSCQIFSRSEGGRKASSLIVARINSQRCAVLILNWHTRMARESILYIYIYALYIYIYMLSLFVPFILPCSSKKMYFYIYSDLESAPYKEFTLLIFKFLVILLYSRLGTFNIWYDNNLNKICIMIVIFLITV